MRPFVGLSPSLSIEGSSPVRHLKTFVPLRFRNVRRLELLGKHVAVELPSLDFSIEV